MTTDKDGAVLLLGEIAPWEPSIAHSGHRVGALDDRARSWGFGLCRLCVREPSGRFNMRNANCAEDRKDRNEGPDRLAGLRGIAGLLEPICGACPEDLDQRAGDVVSMTRRSPATSSQAKSLKF
jgi:hypothetical protein